MGKIASTIFNNYTEKCGEMWSREEREREDFLYFL
jgi:hypothetical protein